MARRGLLLVAAAGAVLVLLGATAGTSSEPPWFDAEVLEFTIEHRVPVLEELSRLLGALGVFAVLMPASVVGAWMLARRGADPWRAGAVPAALWATALASAALKSVHGRARPPEILHLGDSSSAAFPSGHAAHAAALGVAIMLALASEREDARATRTLSGVAGVLVATMGLSRVVLRVHWLTDVIAGWLLGATVAVMVHLVARAVGARSGEAAHPDHETETPRT